MQRRSDLDALRGFAMLLGIALHASLSFLPFPWPVHDTQQSDVLLLCLAAVHGFRMPLFFLLSGYFTMLVFARRGLRSLLWQRVTRIFLPLAIGLATLVPLDAALARWTRREIPPDPAVAEILAGDAAAVRRRLAAPGAAEAADAFWGRTPLAWATMHGDPAIVAAVLDAGGDVAERDFGGNTLLHHAVYFGHAAAGRLLLERGADPLVENAVGRLPIAMAALSADISSEFAPLVGLDPRPVDAVIRGRGELGQVLPTGPNPAGTFGGPLDRATLAWSRALGSDRFRLGQGRWAVQLFETNLFDHLWFLWFLCWLVVAFAALARTGLLPSGRLRWWLVVASCLPQAVMGVSMAGSYGPDTSLGLLPRPHVLGFYACFYFFGVATFAAEGLDTRLGRWWKLLLPTAVVLFVAGIAALNDRWLATLLQPAYAWTMSIGLIGLFSRWFSRPHPAAGWLADASYWMYLVHVPLVMAAQWFVRPWPLQPLAKFGLILVIVTPLLLASYQWGVRFTAIGRLLNGPRRAPEPVRATAG